MLWCVSYSSLEVVDWSLYGFGGEEVNDYLSVILDYYVGSY